MHVYTIGYHCYQVLNSMVEKEYCIFLTKITDNLNILSFEGWTVFRGIKIVHTEDLAVLFC